MSMSRTKDNHWSPLTLYDEYLGGGHNTHQPAFDVVVKGDHWRRALGNFPRPSMAWMESFTGAWRVRTEWTTTFEILLPIDNQGWSLQFSPFVWSQHAHSQQHHCRTWAFIYPSRSKTFSQINYPRFTLNRKLEIVLYLHIHIYIDMTFLHPCAYPLSRPSEPPRLTPEEYTSYSSEEEPPKPPPKVRWLRGWWSKGCWWYMVSNIHVDVMIRWCLLIVYEYWCLVLLFIDSLFDIVILVFIAVYS